MRFVADESVDYPIIQTLRRAGHDVQAIVEIAPGTSDDEVLNLANREHAPLITADKDFGELVHRLGQANHGVILIRLAGQSPSAKAELVKRVFEDRHAELDRAFTVITAHSVRIRRGR